MCRKCLILTVGRLSCTYLFCYAIRHKLKTIKSAFKSDHAEQLKRCVDKLSKSTYPSLAPITVFVISGLQSVIY